MSQRATAPREQRDADVLTLLRQLWTGLASYRLYPGSLDRPGFVAAVERIQAAAERAMAAGAVDVEITAEGFRGPAGPLPADESAERLARACYERRAERLVVRSTPGAEDLAALFDVLAMAPAEVEAAGGPETVLEGTGARAVALLRVGPEPVAAADHVPEGLEAEAPSGRWAFSAELLLEELSGTAEEQASSVLSRLRELASSTPDHVVQDAAFHRQVYQAVAELPEELRREITATLLDSVLQDPFSGRLIGSLGNAELARALVDLGRDPRRDSVGLARRLAENGVRGADLIDLTAALAAGHEEAGTIMAGLERMGLKLDELPDRKMRGESISEVLSRYLLESEAEDRSAIRDLAVSGDQAGLALAAVGDYLALEEDVERLEDVLDVWAVAVRRALREEDRDGLAALASLADRAVQETHGVIGVVSTARRKAFDPDTVGILLASEETPRVLEPLGSGGVESLMDHLAEEPERSRRARLVALLSVMARSHPGPVASRLMDPRWYVVRNAVTILGRAGGEGALDDLASVLEHPEAAVRLELTSALVTAGGPQAVPLLARLARDPEEDVRTRAADGLGSITTSAAAAALAELARDSAWQSIRRRALETLGRHPSQDSLVLLQELASRRSRPRLPGRLRRRARALARGREADG